MDENIGDYKYSNVEVTNKTKIGNLNFNTFGNIVYINNVLNTDFRHNLTLDQTNTTYVLQNISTFEYKKTITEIKKDKKDIFVSHNHNLKKGVGYHLDLAVVSVLTGICSLLGMPWLVAATVRSLNHVRSLATMEVVVKPDGYKHERVLHVRENRITGLVTGVLIGSTLLFLPFMKVIPLAVLYGLFLFMGIVSLVSSQFFERLSCW